MGQRRHPASSLPRRVLTVRLDQSHMCVCPQSCAAHGHKTCARRLQSGAEPLPAAVRHSETPQSPGAVSEKRGISAPPHTHRKTRRHTGASPGFAGKRRRSDPARLQKPSGKAGLRPKPHRSTRRRPRVPSAFRRRDNDTASATARATVPNPGRENVPHT